MPMHDTISAAREHNTLALIHIKLATEHIRDIFLALSLIDTPSLKRPQGWYLQVNGVCRLWREISLDFAGLWARNAGSFPARRMTDLMIERARKHPLSFEGHYEDHDGSGYVLTDYQLSLIPIYIARLRSLAHDEYTDWSDLFYRLGAFPQLESTRICDDSGPDMWHARLDAPNLHSLHLNNALIPFTAPKLRYLRIDMDNIDWRSERDISGSFDEPMLDSCAAISRIFPTRDFIAFLQCSATLERLIVTDMPLLMPRDLPTVSELHARLPRLRGLHLSGKSQAMGDLWRRLVTPPDTRICVDRISPPFEFSDIEIRYAVRDMVDASVYDSMRLAMTSSYDIMIQLWSSASPGARGLELSESLQQAGSREGPAFTLREPVGSRALLQTFPDPETGEGSRYGISYVETPHVRFQNDMARQFYGLVGNMFPYFSLAKHLDLTDIPYVDHKQNYTAGYEKTDHPMARLFRAPDGSLSPRRSVVLNWSLISCIQSKSRVNAPGRLQEFYLPNSVEALTIVNFPCASFPSIKRYDNEVNEQAWNDLLDVCKACYHSRLQADIPPFSLKLAESSSEMSNTERSEESEYEHTFEGSYEDAVRAITEEGRQWIAPFVASFEDLRIHTWPN
ncbi:unnamed protein product [Peniophora sp. CBMAI 1063]|nr:unnamed protein product [Peniophora sp. CBMAI 1063]